MFFTIVAVVFGAVSLAHLLRVINGWTVSIASWDVPMAVSWVGFLVTAMLCAWAIALATSSRRAVGDPPA